MTWLPVAVKILCSFVYLFSWQHFFLVCGYCCSRSVHILSCIYNTACPLLSCGFVYSWWYLVATNWNQNFPLVLCLTESLGLVVLYAVGACWLWKSVSCTKYVCTCMCVYACGYVMSILKRVSSRPLFHSRFIWILLWWWLEHVHVCSWKIGFEHGSILYSKESRYSGFRLMWTQLSSVFCPH